MQVHTPVWKLANSSPVIRPISEKQATGHDESSIILQPRKIKSEKKL
jgi:hypothetical protein